MAAQPESGSRPGASERSTFFPWVLSIGLAVSALWLGMQLWIARSENRILAAREAAVSVALKSAQTQIEAEQIIGRGVTAEYLRQTTSSETAVTLLLPPAGSPSTAFGATAWDGSRRHGMVVVHGLPALPEGQVYALWQLEPKPICLGILPSPVDGIAKLGLQPADALPENGGLAISRESVAPNSEHAAPSAPVLISIQ